MNNLNFSGDFFGQRINIKRVQKRTAKKLYLQGSRVFIQSCNFHPFGVWSKILELDFAERNLDERNERDFEAYICNFEYYNCSDAETGLYTAFYVLEN